VGRTELQYGDEHAVSGAERLHDSLHDTLLALPDDVAVLPGHFAVGTGSGPSGDAVPAGDPVATTIGEAASDIELLGVDRHEFVRRVTDSLPPKPSGYEQIIDVNLGRIAPDTETLTQLELGPNNCAATAQAAGADAD
jgi:hypothetical protein